MEMVSAYALLLFSAAQTDGTAFVEGFVESERGFLGAVTVISEEVDEGLGVVTVEVPFRDVRGQAKAGRACLYVRSLEAASGHRLPAFCAAHYELPVDGARKWCERGFVVVSPHYDGEGDLPAPGAAIGDSYNLGRAVMQWVRRLPFVERTKVHLHGGSQGGYMALALAADSFPICSVTPDMPVVNWAYNLAYIEANRSVARYPQKDLEESPLPVLCAVTGLVDWCEELFGKDLAAQAWYLLSPISYADRITSPVLLLCATGDMLTPHVQVTRKYQRAFDESRFPEGYKRDFDELTQVEAAREALDEVLPPERVWIHVEPPQTGACEVTLAHFLKKEPAPAAPPFQERPWSPDYQWSIVVLDEGAPVPFAGHSRLNWRTSPESFVIAHTNQDLPVDLANGPKLDYLLQRYSAELTNLPVLADGQPVNRLSFEKLERLDVVAGLLDYAEVSRRHAKHLRSVYAEGARKPFGEELDVDWLRVEQSGLCKMLGL